MVGTYALREVGVAQLKIVESCTDSCQSLKSTFETELDPLVKQVGVPRTAPRPRVLL